MAGLRLDKFTFDLRLCQLDELRDQTADLVFSILSPLSPVMYIHTVLQLYSIFFGDA